MTRKRLVIASNTAWNIANFRGELIRAFVSAGYEVIAAAPPDKYVPIVESLGARFVPLPIDNQGTNPCRDIVLFWRLFILLRRERPAVFIGYTPKPNIYGGLAARLLRVPAINNIAGLGSVFIRRTWLTQLVQWLYRAGLKDARKVFFQNAEDKHVFLSSKLVKRAVIESLPGSGVDTKRFVPLVSAPEEQAMRPFLFLYSGRLLWEKGIGEFVEAARRLKGEGVCAEFGVLGFVGVPNPSAVSTSDVRAWESEGVISYMGSADDVRPIIATCDCFVLPSYYREGVPRSLLEAASMEKPIITTDSVGCRDAVEDGVNGFLCRPRDINDLAEKMRLMATLSSRERRRMGKAGRQKMIREFDESFVIKRYIETVAQITQ
jgi:glycosyltransferase involved in cell wall biosynthesis